VEVEEKVDEGVGRDIGKAVVCSVEAIGENKREQEEGIPKDCISEPGICQAAGDEGKRVKRVEGSASHDI